VAKELLTSPYQSDKALGFRGYMHSNAPDIDQIKEATKAQWAKHPVSLESYIMNISCIDSDQVSFFVKLLDC